MRRRRRMMRCGNESLLPCEFAGGRLRRMRPGDLACFQAYRAIPALRRYQGWAPMSDPEAATLLARMHDKPLLAPSQWLQLGIGEQASDALIGDINLYLADDGLRCEIGFTLAPAAQGRGIATAAVGAALRVLFAATGMQEVLGTTDSRNLASARLLQRLGFRLRERRDVVDHRGPHSEERYVLLRREFEAGGGAAPPPQRSPGLG